MRYSFRDQVAAAVRVSLIRSPVAYSWFGQASEPLPGVTRRALPQAVAREYLRYLVQSRLYNDFYCKGFAAPPEPEQPAGQDSSDGDFVAALAAANSGRGCLAPGWTVRAVEADEVVVYKDGLCLWVQRRDCLTLDAEAMSPGTSVSLRLPKGLPERAPGFYTALGDEEPAAEEDKSIVRLYWNVTADGAAAFMRATTTALNHARVPFHLKIVSNPTRFVRCDAAVIYLRQASYGIVADVLASIYLRAAPFLEPATPVFTKELAPGLGLAEDPGNGESFGWHRCQLLADGMIRAYEQGQNSRGERVEAIEKRFAEEGVSLDAPYLNQGSRDGYCLDADIGSVAGRRLGERKSSPVAREEQSFLEAAAGIGARLSREAVWHQGQCNWLGLAPEERRVRGAPPSFTYSALGPELYSGTSGMALFLAELHIACGDEEIGRSALGAMRHALARAEAVRPQDRLGLFTGRAGIALAAARVGTLLGLGEFLERASELAAQDARGWPEDREFDLMSGDAGTIVAFLALHGMLGNGSLLLDAASRLGEDMLRRAVKTPGGYSWRSVGRPTPRNLTGLSHGTSGAAYALLELSIATGEPEFREAALQAFAYERQWFDAAAGNWPDFRESASRAGSVARPHRFAVAWCHGAPGIALSRLRACELVSDEACEEEAIAGLKTTRSAVGESLRYRTGNWSLCHGLAGNADVLLQAGRMLGSQPNDWMGVALELATEGVRNHARSGHNWPCGAGDGPTPGLMLGLAGVGYFYLRLHSSQIPSVLMPYHAQVSALFSTPRTARQTDPSWPLVPERSRQLTP